MKNQNQNDAEATGGKALTLRANETQIDSGATVLSVYQTQAISDIARMERNVPLVNDANVIRERKWSIENQK